jgi:hypothetical protein
MREITRKCVVCGKKIKVKLEGNKIVGGGNYFKTDKDFEKKYGEYWECDKCYKE